MRAPFIFVLSHSRAATAEVDFTPFTNEATSRGLNYLVAAYGAGPGFLGSGLCAADLDGDGHCDVVAMGKASGLIGVFKNLGGGQFAAQISGIAAMPLGSGVAAGDFDSDGDLDLVFSQMGAPPRLYRHDAPFAFTDVTAASNLAGDHAGRSIAWFDADGDGRLDILMACYAGYTTALANSATKLWRNQGNSTFVDVTESSGLGDPMRTFVACPFDFDNDGDGDIYVSNDRGHLGPDYEGNRLYRNDGGFFTDISSGCGASPGYFSMGVAVGDLDENGLIDLMTTNIASENQPLGAINPLFMAVKPGVFQESSVSWGIAPVFEGETGWAVHFLDADNDGLHDLFLNNQATPDRFFRNLGSGTMQEMASAANLSGSAGFSFCSVVADFDGDGGLDILSNHSSGNLRLMMNHEGLRRNWLSLRIRADGFNRDAVGASVVVQSGGRTMSRSVFAGGTGYLGMSDSFVHVGCGSGATAIVQVRWPNSNETRVLTQLPTSSRWTIYPQSMLGDGDGDGDADGLDLVQFDGCAARGVLTAGCEMFDFDGNSTLDESDRSALQVRIAHDACDLNHDGRVSAADLTVMLGSWGGASEADIDGSGNVDALDLALLLAAWG